MCGIAGLAASDLDAEELEQRAARMAAALRHRGPDAEGLRVFADGRFADGVALAHRRLAIIDLSDAGIQPMPNEDETVWVTFNGEIYNFEPLRAELLARGHVFRSRTDTEVLVHLYEEMGPAMVERLVGIFAFGILDRRRRRLFLARDHVGTKPLYYAEEAGRLLFASEIKGILAARDRAPDVDWQAISDYFTFLYVPGEASAFAGIRQLPAAHTLTYDLERRTSRIERYWRVRDLPGLRQAPRAEVEARLFELLEGAVGRELVSDVPLGVFLSGGLDSATLAGLAARSGVRPRTFTVDFTGSDARYYSEAELAKATSGFLGTEHTQLDVSAVDPLEMLSLVEHFDQPFGNPTYYLQWLIARAAREHITVALNGAGGDELFAGYPRYRAAQLARALRWVPASMLRVGRRALDFVQDDNRTMRVRRAREFLDGLDADPVRAFGRWTYHLTESEKASLFGTAGGGRPRGFAAADRHLRRAYDDSALRGGNRLLHLDVETFLVDNLLAYTDRMSMAVSMEVRVPLLEPEFVEYALNVPFDWKLPPSGGKGKAIMRSTFRRLLAPVVRNAPKKGFNAPLGLWLRGPLDQYFEASRATAGGHPLHDTLGADMGVTWKDGLLDWDTIDTMRAEHRAGRADLSYELFAVIVFDVWFRKYVTGTMPMEHWSPARTAGVV